MALTLLWLCQQDPTLYTRSAEKFIDAVQALLECESHSLSQLQAESDSLNLYPFVDMIPWVGRPCLPTAIGFLGRYLQIVRPIIVVAMGELVANTLASNIIHTSGLPNGKYTQHVGIPRIMSCASEDWVYAENVDEPDPSTLSILIPIFDPGMFKQHESTKLPNTLLHLCMQALFLHISEAMTMLDEGVLLHLVI
ncbi:hypothetical protein NQZ79_g6579 [Umbelopsis isabellina]|nr:hypothetical protein NQZ79_g6579 [Umbelopsis isabellina]